MDSEKLAGVRPSNAEALLQARIFHELLSRERVDGRATGQPSRGTAGLVSVPERYVAGSDTRGRQEGRPYNSRSLRSAQSRKRVPSFVVAVSYS